MRSRWECLSILPVLALSSEVACCQGCASAISQGQAHICIERTLIHHAGSAAG